MKKQFIVSVAFLLSATFATAQSIERWVIGTAGNWVASSSISLEYSVGEPVVTTVFGQSVILTQGFTQPDQVVLGISAIHALPLSISVYPNPAINQIQLALQSEQPMRYYVEVFDVTGRSAGVGIVASFENGNTETLDISGIQSGSYFLKTVNEQQQTISVVRFQKL